LTVFLSVVFIVLGPLLDTPAQAAQPDARAISFSEHERAGHKEIEIHTALADYLFSTQGGVLSSVYLDFAPLGMSPAEALPTTVTTVQTASSGYLRRTNANASFPFALTLNDSPDQAVYDYEYTPQGSTAILSFHRETNGLRITKRYEIYDDPYYTLGFSLTIQNVGSLPISWDQGYRLSLGPGVGRPTGQSEPRYLFDGQVSHAPLERSSYQAFQGAGFIGQGLVFFLKINAANGTLTPTLPTTTADRNALWLESGSLQLAPGESRSLESLLYAGRAKYTLLEHLGLEKLVGLDFFSQFIVPVSQFLNWLYQETGNYGWAIMLFTLIVRLLLFPLSRQQFHSMYKMAEAAPKLKKLQQQYPTLRRLRELHPRMSQEELLRRDRENRQQLQEKMMALYREEGVNPLGGCLPMLIQFPILIVLWQAITYSAELVHLSPGFLWIPDLALRDPYYIIVGLTVIAMLFQARTTPMMSTSTSGQNPLLFGAISALFMALFLRDFPAGLWAYYFLTTLVQVGQQLFIAWELERLKAKRTAERALTAATSSEPAAVERPEQAGEEAQL
jgi:YidC/Oxa1 family membrane protein insertase